MTTPAVTALAGIVPVAVAGGVALNITDRALGKRREGRAPAPKARSMSKAQRLEIVKAAFRLRLTATQARQFTKDTGRKLPTLTQAKNTMKEVERLRRDQLGGTSFHNRRRGL